MEFGTILQLWIKLAVIQQKTAIVVSMAVFICGTIKNKCLITVVGYIIEQKNLTLR